MAAFDPTMAAFQPSVSDLASRAGPTGPNPAGLAGTSMLKHKQQHGKAALRPSNELARKNRAQRAPRGASLRPQLPGATRTRRRGGAEPDSAIPSEVVDNNIHEREARGDHRRW